MYLKKIDGDMAQTAVISLSILKSISKMRGIECAAEFMPVEPDWDTVHYLFFSALDLSAEKVRYKYFEDLGTEIIATEFEYMTEYFKLAYRFGELKKLAKESNPYLINAYANADNTLGEIEHYSFDFFLRINKRRKPRLMLAFYPDFYPNAEVIYQLYNFLLFFRTALPLLDSELKAIKKVKEPIRIKKTYERKKAA